MKAWRQAKLTYDPRYPDCEEWRLADWEGEEEIPAGPYIACVFVGDKSVLAEINCSCGEEEPDWTTLTRTFPQKEGEKMEDCLRRARDWAELDYGIGSLQILLKERNNKLKGDN